MYYCNNCKKKTNNLEYKQQTPFKTRVITRCSKCFKIKKESVFYKQVSIRSLTTPPRY